MSAFTEWRDGIEKRIVDSVSAGSGEPGTSQQDGSVLQAIYAYGRGQIDTAIQKATTAFRKTSTGQKVEAEATKQKIAELMPYIILGVLAIVFGSYLVFHRR